MVIIKLNKPLASEHLIWLYNNIGSATHWFHNQQGGYGWRYKIRKNSQETQYILEIDDDKMATFYTLLCSS